MNFGLPFMVGMAAGSRPASVRPACSEKRFRSSFCKARAQNQWAHMLVEHEACSTRDASGPVSTAGLEGCNGCQEARG